MNDNETPQQVTFSEREAIVAALRKESEANEKEANRLWGMGGPDEIGEAVVRKAVASAAKEWAQSFEEGWHVARAIARR